MKCAKTKTFLTYKATAKFSSTLGKFCTVSCFATQFEPFVAVCRLAARFCDVVYVHNDGMYRTRFWPRCTARHVKHMVPRV